MGDELELALTGEQRAAAAATAVKWTRSGGKSQISAVRRVIPRRRSATGQRDARRIASASPGRGASDARLRHQLMRAAPGSVDSDRRVAGEQRRGLGGAAAAAASAMRNQSRQQVNMLHGPLLFDCVRDRISSPTISSQLSWSAVVARNAGIDPRQRAAVAQ